MKSESRFLERRRQKRSRHPWSNLRCSMDVTGLASVMIVLVVIFFFNDLFMTQDACGTPMSMVEAGHAKAMPGANRENALLINVTRDNRVFFGADRIDPEYLWERIRDGVVRGSERKVYIRADGRAHYGTVLRVLNGVRTAGLSDVAFLVEARRVPLPDR